MAKVKYDASGDIAETQNAPVGIYRAKIAEAIARDSNAGNPMIEIKWTLTHDASGSKVTEDYWPVRLYLMVADDRDYAKRGIKEFCQALGLKLKGTIDTDKLVGKEAQLKLKSDTDQDGEYQPRISKVLPLAEVEAEEEPEPDEEPEAEAEPEPEEDAIDLDSMDRDELKKFIRDEQLGSLADLGINKATTDDEIREIIVNAMGDGEEPEDESEPEPEPEEEPEAEASSNGKVDYTVWSVGDLKKELAERELPTNGAKAVLAARLAKDDGDEPF